MMKYIWCVALVAAVATMAGTAALAQASKAETAIDLIRTLNRPGQINLATIWDGNKYVQCRPMKNRAIRCEAAGTLMQPSLEHVLTPDRIARFTAKGWVRDPAFGNYVRSFPPDTPARIIANEIRAILALVYSADITDLMVETHSVADEPCPPRNGWTQNLAGMINDAAAMKGVLIHACSYRPEAASEPERTLAYDSTLADLIALYGPGVTREIARLRLNIHRDIFVVFGTGVGYVQCETATDPDAFYCEAQSADSWPALAAVLTPDRIARLHSAGYADPGRKANYSKTYLADKMTDAAVATDILTVLHDAYGYYGASKLEIEPGEW
jgi:hypothetical protein